MSEPYNPYAAPATALVPDGTPLSDVGPQPWSTQEAITLSWQRFRAHWLVLTASNLLCTIFSQIGFSLLGAFAQRAPMLALVASVPCVACAAFLHTGLLRLWLVAARGQTPTLGVLFSGADATPRLIATYLLMIILVAIGFVLLIVPGFILSLGLYYAPFYAVDTTMGPVQALKASWAASDGQKGELFGLGMVAALIVTAGLLACCVGYFAAVPIVWVAVAIAFTRASGRSPAPRLEYNQMR